jgi:hypothetical protein
LSHCLIPPVLLPAQVVKIFPRLKGRHDRLHAQARHPYEPLLKNHGFQLAGHHRCFMGNCRRYGINPFGYLKDLFTRLPAGVGQIEGEMVAQAA